MEEGDIEMKQADVEQQQPAPDAEPMEVAEEKASSEESSMDEELDEEDLDLLEHTLGERRGFRHLQRRGESDEEEEAGKAAEEGPSEEASESEEEMIGAKRKGTKRADLDKLFEESSEEEEKAGAVPGDEDESDLEDFIEDDLLDEEEARERAAYKAQKARDSKLAKKPLHGVGIYSKMSGLSKEVIQDMLDIFGDGTEYADMIDDHLANELDELDISSQERQKKKKAAPLPEVLIKEDDVPERYAAYVALHEGELGKEAIWIADRLLPFVQERNQEGTMESLIPVVAAVVSMIREQLVEIPFIATHRKEYFQHMLGINDLWRIHDWDEEWRVFNRQRESFLSFVGSKAPEHAAVISAFAEDCADVADLETLQEYFKQVLRYGHSTNARTKLHHDTLLGDRLMPMVRSVCLKPQDFLMNWAMKERRHEPATPEQDDVGMVALDYVSEELPSHDLVLHHFKKLAAAELAFYPTTAKMLRTALEAVACVSVKPTAAGMKEITSNHELAQFKFLAEKPLATFTDDLYPRLLKAEKAGLLTVTIGFRRLEDLMSEWSDYFSGSTASEWSSMRQEILKVAIEEFTIPRMKRHVAGLLAKQADLLVSQACQYTLQSKLMQAPFMVKRAPSPTDSVLAISWGTGQPHDATMCVSLDFNGRVVDLAKFTHLQDVRPSEEEWARLGDLISTVQPTAIVVGGLSVRTVDLFDRIYGLVKEHRLDSVVVFGEDDAARIYQNSPRAQAEFPEYSVLLRYCVSLGRRWLNPLFELTALSVPELARLALHPNQSLVSSQDLRDRYIARAVVNVTNLVGVDLPRAVAHPWTRSPLKYIAGLGPIKADLLVQILQKHKVESRSELRSLLGPVVFLNCAGFLVFPHGSDPLDETRIHPDNYALARKIACDAMELTVAAEEADQEEEQCRQAVRDVMEQIERLNDLLLDEYARELEKRLGVPKHLTLLDIKAELQAPFADLRTVVNDTPPEVVFEALTGETEASLFVGQRVQAKVTRVSDRAAYCRLESGLTGILPLDNLPPTESGRPPTHPGKAVRPQQVILAVVLEIHLTRFEVTLSMRPDDMKEPRAPRLGDYDTYYDHETANNVKRTARRGFSGDQPAATATTTTMDKPRRMISHPSYKEVSRIEAERLLSSAVLGEAIIRPSGSHGAGHLTLTWKIDQCEQGGLFQHVDVTEGQRTTDFSLGKQLSIQHADGSKHVYEDLDEIIARFVEPLSTYLQDVRTCPKYLAVTSLDRTGARSQIEAWLATQRSLAPGRIAYCLSLNRERPGSVLLSYQPGSRAYHETVDVTPSGYRLRGLNFERLEALINWFKQNYHKR